MTARYPVQPPPHRFASSQKVPSFFPQSVSTLILADFVIFLSHIIVLVPCSLKHPDFLLTLSFSITHYSFSLMQSPFSYIGNYLLSTFYEIDVTEINKKLEPLSLKGRHINVTPVFCSASTYIFLIIPL